MKHQAILGTAINDFADGGYISCRRFVDDHGDGVNLLS